MPLVPRTSRHPRPYPLVREEPLLATCLRVNHTFFEVAESHLYGTIDAREDEYDSGAIVRGAAIGDECQQGGGQQDDTVPTRTNFKGLLLKKIKRLHLGQHPDWRKPDLRAACGHMTSLQFIHIWRPGSASQIRGTPGPPSSTPEKAVYEMGWSQWRDLLRCRTLIQDSRKIAIVISNVVSSLQHLKDNEVCIPEELRPMMRNIRILFTGKGHERLDTPYVEWIPSIESYELAGPDFMGFLCSRPDTMLYYLLTLGAEIYVLKDPEDRLNVTWFDQQIAYATETPERRFRLDDLKRAD